jgi:two-component system, LytTR family, response regulator
MRALIIDDESLSRTALANVLATRRDIEEFDSAGDAVEAMEKISTTNYDVLLVDIKMPGTSGIELLDRVKWRATPLPSIIFVTAHQEHALAAFSKHAIDYVLKPFSRERINEALDAAFRRSEGERAARLIDQLPQLRKHKQEPSVKIAIKADGRILFIDPGEVFSVEADRNYVLLQREASSYLLRESISVIADKLKPFGFIRIHRSVLINSAFVEEIKPSPTGEYELRLRGGREFTVTRSYRQNLKQIAASWIGTRALR